LASPGILSETKFVFTNDYEIKIPNTLFVDNKGSTFRKICDNYKDFNNQTYLKFRKIIFIKYPLTFNFTKVIFIFLGVILNQLQEVNLV